MNTYTLPSATVAALPAEVGAVVYVAVKGELIETCQFGPDVTHSGPCIIVSPSVLADLNGLTCDTSECRGGQVQYPEWEGRTETCQTCAGTGRALLTIQHEHLCFHEGQRMLDKDVCDCGTDDGVVTDPRRWTVDGLWPVVAFPKLDDWPKFDCVVIDPKGDEPSFIYAHSDGMTETITVTGWPPSPGEFVVVLTLAASS